MIEGDGLDVVAKVVLLGEWGVGKTSLVRQYIHHEFQQRYQETLGVDFENKIYFSPDLRALGFTRPVDSVTVYIWDIGGQNSNSGLLEYYTQGATCALVLFDLTRPETLVKTNEWIGRFHKQCPGKPCLLIGNKVDLIEDRQVTDADIQAAGHSECILSSASDAESVQRIFERVLLGKILDAALPEQSP
jgi:small GTP-binding protein